MQKSGIKAGIKKRRRKRRTDLFSLSCSAPLSSPSPAVVVPIRPFVPPSALSIFLIALPFFLALFWCSFLFKGFLLRVCGRGQIECCANGPRLAGYPKIHGPFTSTSRTIPATAPKKKSDAFFGDFPLSSFFFFFFFVQSRPVGWGRSADFFFPSCARPRISTSTQGFALFLRVRVVLVCFFG
ncbi:hypothetical protein [Pandoravirus japonicus]|uniref:Transmembrane protein n=1 Tax=Pandoravirus japonicus TaxID=2823154 RepID=A0A811BLX3_9VIRU|nr:hypothetical protein [Pandoravirus japonicus]